MEYQTPRCDSFRVDTDANQREIREEDQMIDRRTLLGTIAGCAATMGLSACGRQDDGSHKGADAVPVSWVKCRLAEAASIDPLLVEDRAGLQVLSAVFMPLMALDPDGNLIAAAASSYEMSEDAKTFTFHLVKGASFSNGESVTATSFKIGWERLVRAIPADGEGEAGDVAEYGRWGHLLRLVDGYEALRSGRASELVGLRCPDDLTYVVSLTESYSFFAEIAAHPALAPVPTLAYQDAAAFAEKPIGNGPFKLKRAWKPGGELQLTANKDCIAGAPVADGVLLTPISDTVTAFKQLRAGNIDVCDVPVDQLADAEEMAGVSEDGATMGPDGRLSHGIEGGLLYLACNCTSGPFSQIDVRRAASMAIDRETLARKVLRHSAEMAVGPISPRLGESQPWDACSYDPERAVQLVEAVSLAAEDAARADMGSAPEGAEVPTAESDPLSLSVDLIYRKGGTRARVAAHVVSDLEAIGLSVKSEGLGPEEFAERYRSADFDCALMTLEPPVPTAAVVADALFDGAGRAHAVPASHDADVAETLSRARAAIDPEGRASLVWEAVSRAGESVRIIPLAHPAYTKIAADRIVAATVDASGMIDLGTVDLL